MKILYDYQIIIRQKIGGISRYHYEIAKNIKRINNNICIKVPVLFSCNYYFQEYFGKKAKTFANKYLNYIIRLINEAYTILQIFGAYVIGKPYDIIHPTFYLAVYLNLYLAICKKRKFKLVITIHDTIHEMEALKNPIMRRGAVAKEKMLKHADAVIAISEHTKKDLLKWYPFLDERKISVIYHGFNQPNLAQMESIGMELPKKYVFFVGSRKGYKNFDNFIRAMGIVKKSIPDIEILCAGGGPFSYEEEILIDSVDLNGSIKQKFFSDNELLYAYTKAQCFVFPSLYEGFGMPILEAFSCRCPVILSNSSCFPEIAKDAALYCDGTKPKEMARQIENIISYSKLRNELVVKGLERLKKFSWDSTARATYDVYLKVKYE